jgi:hypothetical protein
MRVRMRTIYASPTITIDAGAEGELPDAEAKALIEGGYAERVSAEPDSTPVPERADQKPRGKTAERR